MDQFIFDSDFEESLLARFKRDRVFYLKYNFLVKIDYFSDQVRRDIYSVLKEYYSNYSDPISNEILKNEILNRIRSKKTKEESEFKVIHDLYYDAMNRLDSLTISVNEKYTVDNIVRFARRQETKKLIIDVHKNVDRNDFEFENVTKDMSKILSLGAELDIGYDYFAETIPRTSHIISLSENKVGTGFKTLNTALGGGLGPGELGIIVGPPSRGKTATLVNLAVGALINRKNVVFFGFEGSKEELSLRFDMRISRISKDFLRQESNKVRDSVLYFSRLLKTKLLLKMYPTENATVNDMNNFLTYAELTTGFVPDEIFIDYLNIVKQTNPKADSWKGANYSEGKALGMKRNKPVWSGVQAKMDSLRSDIITPRHIAEATGRIWAIADVIIGLCQSEEEETHKPMEMRFYLGKNRNKEAKRIIPIVFDADIMVMEEFKINA